MSKISKDMMHHLGEEYLKQGASIDDMVNYSGLLNDIRFFLKKYRLNVIIKDEIFYKAIATLVDQYDNDGVKQNTQMVRNTLKSSMIHSTLPAEIKSMLTDTLNIDKVKMDELLNILYRELTMDYGDQIDLEPEDKIPDSEGKGFMKAKQEQKLKDVKKEINGLVKQIKENEQHQTVERLTPSEKFGLKSNKMKLVHKLSTLIGAPGNEKESEYALSEVPELMTMEEPDKKPDSRTSLLKSLNRVSSAARKKKTKRKGKRRRKRKNP